MEFPEMTVLNQPALMGVREVRLNRHRQKGASEVKFSGLEGWLGSLGPALHLQRT